MATPTEATLPGKGVFDCKKPGTAIINSVVQDHAGGSGTSAFNFGPGKLFYGVTSINNGLAGDVPPPHNVYTQNSDANGKMYFIQFISLDNAAGGTDTNRFNIHAFGTNGPVQSMHFQDGVIQKGRAIWRRQNYASQNVQNITMDNMLFDTLNISTKWQMGNADTPAQFQVTSSIFRNTEIQALATLGVGDTCASYPPATKFTGNKVWSPSGGNYINFRTGAATGSCGAGNKGTGAFKIRDIDEWNNNTYGPSGTFTLHANGVNSGSGLSLAQWRTATQAARETGGGTAFDASSTVTSLPTTDEIHCFDNFYQPGWGYCWGIDWSGNGAITITGTEADKIIGNGKTYKVRNIRDFYGTPLASGTYTAGAGLGAITLPSGGSTGAVNGVLIVWITSQR